MVPYIELVLLCVCSVCIYFIRYTAHRHTKSSTHFLDSFLYSNFAFFCALAYQVVNRRRSSNRDFSTLNFAKTSTTKTLTILALEFGTGCSSSSNNNNKKYKKMFLQLFSQKRADLFLDFFSSLSSLLDFSNRREKNILFFF